MRSKTFITAVLGLSTLALSFWGGSLLARPGTPAAAGGRVVSQQPGCRLFMARAHQERYFVDVVRSCADGRCHVPEGWEVVSLPQAVTFTAMARLPWPGQAVHVRYTAAPGPAAVAAALYSGRVTMADMVCSGSEPLRAYLDDLAHRVVGGSVHLALEAAKAASQADWMGALAAPLIRSYTLDQGYGDLRFERLDAGPDTAGAPEGLFNRTVLY